MKGRDKSETVVYRERFESEYKIGDVVTVRDEQTGRKQVGTYTLMGQFQGGADAQHKGWWGLRKWGSGERYREENKPVLDESIIEWVDFNNKVRQPTLIELEWQT